MKQTVIVTRNTGGNDGGWGGTPPTSETWTLPCRVDEQSGMTTNAVGDEVNYSAEIMLAGLADIKYNDHILYEDELGRKTQGNPKRIEPVRFFNGKSVITVVYI
ncbi:hypothetical protein [Geomicrobium sp. JCM 19037]|uniref:hypothetical protein n=1 Tax=Geomicrobium sp. JCM 19037 TaxID=1460634 RepID=UPI001267C594|nr:hypothetical protein [Geomicrobium sp. JCM 19037]